MYRTALNCSFRPLLSLRTPVQVRRWVDAVPYPPRTCLPQRSTRRRGLRHRILRGGRALECSDFLPQRLNSGRRPVGLLLRRVERLPGGAIAAVACSTRVWDCLSDAFCGELSLGFGEASPAIAAVNNARPC